MRVKELDWCWTKSLTDKYSDSLTSWSRVLPEKLTGPQLVKKFPAFCETRMFITAFKISRHLSPFLSQINPLPAYPSHFSKGQNHYFGKAVHIQNSYVFQNFCSSCSKLLYIIQKWNIRRLQEVVVVTRGYYTTAHCTDIALGNLNQWYNAGTFNLKLACL
jgi:hypothetical protein